jgi:hypothetical protein
MLGNPIPGNPNAVPCLRFPRSRVIFIPVSGTSNRDMSEILLNIALSAVLIYGILAFVRSTRRRDMRILRQWAEENRFELLRVREKAFLEATPFSYWTRQYQQIYFVKIRAYDGQERSGWVRFGCLFGSWDSEDVLPKWDMVAADSNSNPESKSIS